MAEQQPQVEPMPSYVSLLRWMKSHGLFKRARRGPVHSPGTQAAEHRYQAREVRSYESEYVNGLWHLDFHHGSLRVLLTEGRWAYPILLGILDDRSRLCCHLQWYLTEGARELCHGLCQAFQKRDLPRALLFDNGSAMIAAETEQGLTRLGVLFENTLPFSPYQNGKQESFWGQVEGRLLPMLEGVADLTLDQLNEVSQPWVEMEYIWAAFLLSIAPMKRGTRCAIINPRPTFPVLLPSRNLVPVCGRTLSVGASASSRIRGSCDAKSATLWAHERQR